MVCDYITITDYEFDFETIFTNKTSNLEVGFKANLMQKTTEKGNGGK